MSPLLWADLKDLEQAVSDLSAQIADHASGSAARRRKFDQELL
jgi:hypothetical protein